MMEAQIASETIGFYQRLTWLAAREKFIKFSCRGSLVRHFHICSQGSKLRDLTCLSHTAAPAKSVSTDAAAGIVSVVFIIYP